jgi:mannose/fructose-specific phosphotransferase system component IIA
VTWTNANAWREILMRVFDGFTAHYDVTPDWLVNPETKRRLKLDLLYPDIGAAIRFQGLQGRGRRQRPSLEEEQQQRVRDAARADLCESHGISLVSIDVVGGEPKATMRELSMALSNASRRLAKSSLPPTQKETLTEQVSQARSRLDDVARRVRRPQDLELYAELWQDRQYAGIPEAATEPSSSNGKARAYLPGMAVSHVAFGEGVVQSVRPDTGRDDNLVTVRFVDGAQKTFSASLVSKKLIPL